jgi:hypothetical protein
MTTQDKKYDVLLSRLRLTRPVAGDEGEFTNSIMRAIELKSRKNPSRIITWIRPIMSAAALLLLGLFLYQLNDSQIETTASDPAPLLKFRLVKKEYCTTDTNLRVNKGRALLSQYLCYMKSNRIENDESREYYRKQLSRIQGRSIR